MRCSGWTGHLIVVAFRRGTHFNEGELQSSIENFVHITACTEVDIGDNVFSAIT